MCVLGEYHDSDPCSSDHHRHSQEKIFDDEQQPGRASLWADKVGHLSSSRIQVREGEGFSLAHSSVP